MQNEERINGLETQVRTLKRIVYGFGCLLVAGVVVSATNMQPSPPSSYPNVIKAYSIEADFIVAKNTISGDTINGDTINGDTISGDTISGNTIEAVTEIKTDMIKANVITSQRTIADSIKVKTTIQSPRFEVRDFFNNVPIAALCQGRHGAELRIGDNAGVRVITLGLGAGAGGRLWFNDILSSGKVNVDSGTLILGTDRDGGYMRIKNVKNNELVTDLYVDSSGSGRVTIK
jgi:hypothetical protein